MGTSTVRNRPGCSRANAWRAFSVPTHALALSLSRARAPLASRLSPLASLSRPGTIFHRVIKDFMVQGGDPTGTGRGGTSIWGRKFPDEIVGRNLRHTGAGILSMANSGANTNGSQFFVTLGPTPHLDGKHTVFGRICNGMGCISNMGNVQTNSEDRPLVPVKVKRAFAHTQQADR